MNLGSREGFLPAVRHGICTQHPTEAEAQAAVQPTRKLNHFAVHNNRRVLWGRPCYPPVDVTRQPQPRHAKHSFSV